MKKSIKAQQETGYNKTLEEFNKLQLELKYERNFCELRTLTCLIDGNRHSETRTEYCYREVEVDYKPNQQTKTLAQSPIITHSV